jgi:hypothetical protein
MATKSETTKTADSQQDLATALKALKAALKQTSAAERAEQNIAAKAITPTEFAKIIELIDTAKELFADNAVTLTPAERQRLVASGVRNIGFIQASYLSAEGHTAFLPSYLPMPTYTANKDDFERKRALLAAVNDLAQEISDSMLVASDVVYRDSLAYYNTVKEAMKQKVAGAEGEFNLLKTYFAHTKSSSSDGKPTEAQLERDFHSLLHGTKEGKIVIEKDVPAVEKAKLTVLDNVHSPNEVIEETVEEKLSEL